MFQKCPKISKSVQNVQKCLKMSQNTQNVQKLSTYSKMSKMSKLVSDPILRLQGWKYLQPQIVYTLYTLSIVLTFCFLGQPQDANTKLDRCVLLCESLCVSLCVECCVTLCVELSTCLELRSHWHALKRP